MVFELFLQPEGEEGKTHLTFSHYYN